MSIQIRQVTVYKVNLKVNVEKLKLNWKITPAEVNNIGLLLLGLSPSEVGEKLYRSPKTVVTYRARVMEKLGVDSWTELIYMAVKLGILYDEPMN